MPPATPAFAKARALGRAMRVVIRVGGRVAIPVYNIYGFPGGHHDKEAASRTNAIVEAVVQEIAQRGIFTLPLWVTLMPTLVTSQL